MASGIYNVPNLLTTMRLVLSVVMFGFLSFDYYRTSLALFVIAASTDWIDGFYARRYGLVTTLGRILDPFADKVIVCGTFIFLLAIPALTRMEWGLRAWMVTVIIARELLVTALRSFLEQRGADFSAQFSGKLKMLAQCVAAGVCLYYLWQHPQGQSPADWLWWTLVLSLWTAVALTVYSGVIYIAAAVRLMRG
ncbi:MAG: CDP-diacylglycerol--glycerol-3-phosphate 3-phosphatidyltransferase [Planctomycetota bacterium]